MSPVVFVAVNLATNVPLRVYMCLNVALTLFSKTKSTCVPSPKSNVAFADGEAETIKVVG